MVLTEVLEVDPDLVHPPGEGAAEHHAGRPVEAHPLELCPALLAVPRHLAHADLVADHLHGLAALRPAPAHVHRQQYSGYKYWLQYILELQTLLEPLE